MSSNAIANFSGQNVFESDLSDSFQGQLRRIQQQKYDLTIKALDDFVRRKALEAEATKRGISSDKMLELEVDRKVEDPSLGEVEAFYLAQKDHFSSPFHDIESTLRESLKQAKIQDARTAYLKTLQEKSHVLIMLRPPKTELTYDPARLRGNSKASVTIIEFSDFSCPFCRQSEATLRDLLGRYNGKVNLAYRDFPLNQIHPQAESAAEASRCASEQGEYWQYHDLLFGDLAKRSSDDLLENAKTLGMDIVAFDKCLRSGKYASQVALDFQAGVRAGLTGTPGFFINGVFLEGLQPMAAFEKIIDEELSRNGEKVPGK